VIPLLDEREQSLCCSSVTAHSTRYPVPEGNTLRSRFSQPNWQRVDVRFLLVAHVCDATRDENFSFVHHLHRGPQSHPWSAWHSLAIAPIISHGVGA
jgi:hypothetical protein